MWRWPCLARWPSPEGEVESCTRSSVFQGPCPWEGTASLRFLLSSALAATVGLGRDFGDCTTRAGHEGLPGRGQPTPSTWHPRGPGPQLLEVFGILGHLGQAQWECALPASGLAGRAPHSSPHEAPSPTASPKGERWWRGGDPGASGDLLAP
eukprot:9014969-Alexandrium_andersonii.AAC.1